MKVGQCSDQVISEGAIRLTDAEMALVLAFKVNERLDFHSISRDEFANTPLK